jgi:hypothetical protein
VNTDDRPVTRKECHAQQELVKDPQFDRRPTKEALVRNKSW